jgi:hypothetical protein
MNICSVVKDDGFRNKSGAGTRHRQETALESDSPMETRVAYLRQASSVWLAFFLCISSLHFLDLHPDGFLPASIEEPAAHDHGHEDPGEDHLFLIKKHSSDNFLSSRKFPGAQTPRLSSISLPPRLPPPKN